MPKAKSNNQPAKVSWRKRLLVISIHFKNYCVSLFQGAQHLNIKKKKKVIKKATKAKKIVKKATTKKVK